MTSLTILYNDTRVYLQKEASITYKIILSILFAVSIALASHIKIYMAFTPVPINLGTFAVCASALTLGGFWSFISVAIYLLIGAIGLPVTAGGNILGATTGYLIGYAVCAFVLGKITENRKENILKTSIILFISQITIIHVFGMIGLYIWSLQTKTPYSFIEVIMKGSVPFLIGDSIKAIILSLLMGKIIKK